MSLTEKYKWKIAPLIHNFTENIINEIWSSRQTIVLLKRNPAKMKTCKGYGFKIWTKKHVKGNQEIERDRLIEKNNMQKIPFRQVFMAAISSCITKIDKRKTF